MARKKRRNTKRNTKRKTRRNPSRQRKVTFPFAISAKQRGKLQGFLRRVTGKRIKVK